VILKVGDLLITKDAFNNTNHWEVIKVYNTSLGSVLVRCYFGKRRGSVSTARLVGDLLRLTSRPYERLSLRAKTCTRT